MITSVARPALYYLFLAPVVESKHCFHITSSAYHVHRLLIDGTPYSVFVVTGITVGRGNRADNNKRQLNLYNFFAFLIVFLYGNNGILLHSCKKNTMHIQMNSRQRMKYTDFIKKRYSTCTYLIFPLKMFDFLRPNSIKFMENDA